MKNYTNDEMQMIVFLKRQIYKLQNSLRKEINCVYPDLELISKIEDNIEEYETLLEEYK